MIIGYLSKIRMSRDGGGKGKEMTFYVGYWNYWHDSPQACEPIDTKAQYKRHFNKIVKKDLKRFTEYFDVEYTIIRVERVEENGETIERYIEGETRGL